MIDLKNFLRQPYPFPDRTAIAALVIGVGIGLLMLLLQPFGLSNVFVQHYHLFLAGYGLVSFLVLLFNGLLVIKLFSEFNWNIIRQISWSCWSVFCLGIANYAYTFEVMDDFPFSISALLTFQVYTFFIAIIPITILVLIRQNRLLRMNKNAAEVLNNNLTPTAVSKDFAETVVLTAENNKTQLDIKVGDLAFIESEGNYIQVYARENGSIAATTIRSSIVKAETELAGHPQMIKCHRAFIVNSDFIEHIKGNAQGYRLGIKGSNKEVYVSRQYTKLIKSCFLSQKRAVHP
ncbi:MAG: LytTR family transcriptional regulator DNA-binding domain-containing protein [Candidatus Pedobacter colombiensis]|uniref:LytTR family transcriptional regulator DNA-binding domain-containing protein n=1 Tax=Candidatus Pedobacter colombiensis TaxID=3121371 RepID=A0AAJ6B8Z7_9SPHI|nr:LytTR family DNA-binding domain-containing protein [Pedobacter sp.]WEK21016.1 MAG: LytTR family transcriptional regulator DNA-binding domain-containing protein [Pedobacter sp.]